MKLETNEQERIRAYLLGRMAPGELPDLEQRILVDTAFYEELTIVEDELIDEYLRGELPTSDQGSFESHFMSTPEREEKLRFAQAFKKHVSAFQALQPENLIADRPSERAAAAYEPLPKPDPLSFFPFRNPIPAHAFAGLILLLAVGASWVALKNWRPTAPGKVLAIELAPSVVMRDPGEVAIEKFTISQDTDTVRLQLELPDDDFPVYEAVILDDGQRTIATNTNLKAQSANGRPHVFVDVPRSSLPPADYRIKLKGASAAGDSGGVATYLFRVLK